jgi:hypothetical protein
MLDKLELPMAEMALITAADLATIQTMLDREAETLKRRKETFEAVLLRKFQTDARAGYTLAKKDTGTITIAAPGSNLLSVKVEIDKKVDWDQTKLPAIFNAMKPEDSRHYGKVAYSVPEAIYKAAPPDVQKTLQAARTLKPGKMKFTFVPVADVEEQEAA